MSEGDEKADGAMAAHPKAIDVVEEDDSGGVFRINGFAEESPDDNVASSRFVDDCRPEEVVISLKNLSSFR
jgi:hypothetical protein